ncbi:hypothetical protein [Methyloversatilis sp.]|uniref:hypothetical protein n=1 Tax=Methyloversatilis sp. TaxID=2569862 RepID=UPI003F70AB3E
MKSCWLSVAAIGLLSAAPAHAIDAKYARQLERSGCTQVSELQGCDITKTRAENAAAGVVTTTPAGAGPATPPTPYAGQWVARAADGSTFATLRIDRRERVWVNGRRVTAKRSDGALVFRDGPVLYTIQGDRRLTGEDTWADFDAGTKGVIVAE